MSPEDRERDVLTSLPNARPTRRSAKRAPRAAAAPEEPAKKARAPKKPAAPRKPRAAAKPKTAPKPKPVAAAAEPSSPPPPPAGWASPKEERSHDGSTGDLLGTAVQAVGELAQIGLTYGGQALRQALSRLPLP